MNQQQWSETLAILSRSLDPQRFDTWLRPLRPQASEDSTRLVLIAPNEFIADFLEQHYRDMVLSAIRSVDPSIKTLCFSSGQIPPPQPSSPPPPQEKSNIRPHNLNAVYTFEQFVVGSGNEFAKSVALAVAEAPGRTKFNPLLIYGGVGLGKTHLLHAIGNSVLRLPQPVRVVYSTSEEFYFNFIDAIKNNNTKAFTDEFSLADLLMVDDIQFLAGKESTQEQFFYIFNTLYQQGKQIVLTSDLPPSSLQGLQDRLVSRFQWGLSVDIQPPDLETRVAILKKKAEKDNLTIPEDILYYIAENVSSNIRELESIIIKLLAYASITRSDVTPQLVKQILQDTSNGYRANVGIDAIIEEVASFYSIPVNSIREKNRRKEVAHCRQVAMYVAKMITKNSLKTIGLHFGGRDHSTVVHAIQQVGEQSKKDESLKNDINYIIAKLTNS
jgi:chromosomal replication initiator protein